MRAKNDPDLFTIHVCTAYICRLCRLHATTMRVSLGFISILFFYEQSYVLNCLSDSRFEISSLLIKCHGITRSAGSVTDEEPGKGRGRYDRRTDAIGVAIVSVAHNDDG